MRILRPERASFRLLVLAFVRDYIGEMGASPSYGEIANGLGSNTTRVKNAIRSLSKDGLVLRRPGPRGLVLPSLRDEAVRQLRALGWAVDDQIGAAVAPLVTDSTLLPPPDLDYLPGDFAGDGDGGIDGGRAGNGEMGDTASTARRS